MSPQWLTASLCSVSCDSNLYDAVQPILKDPIGLLDLRQRKTVGNQRCGVQLPLFDQRENLCTITAVHTAGLEREILSVHLRQGQRLILFVQGHYRHHGIGAGTLPGQLKGVLSTGHFQHHIRSSMVRDFLHKLLTILWLAYQNLG